MLTVNRTAHIKVCLLCEQAPPVFDERYCRTCLDARAVNYGSFAGLLSDEALKRISLRIQAQEKERADQDHNVESLRRLFPELTRRS